MVDKSMGYYSGNSNIVKTLVDCTYDLMVMTSKATIPFWKWLFDGWERKEKLDFEDLFKTIKLCKGEFVPLLINEGENDSYIYYTFYVPNGIVKSDFEKRMPLIYLMDV